MLEENKEAERSIIGAAVKDNSSITALLQLEPDDFSDERNRHIFESIVRLYKKGDKVDYITLEHDLSTHRHLEKAGGVAYVVGITDDHASPDMISYHIDIVRRCSAARVAANGMRLALASMDSFKTPEDIISTIEDTVNLSVNRLPTVKTNYIDESFMKLENVQMGKGSGFLDTGIRIIDRFSPGPDELLLIGARPSTGKSAFAMQLAENVLQHGGKPMMFSIEMGPDTVMWRRWSLLSGVPVSKMRVHNRLTQGDWDRLTMAVNTTKTKPYPMVFGKASVGEIATEIAKEQKNGKISVVFIDHLHLMRHPSAQRADLSIKLTLDSLARMSKKLGICTVVLAQLNRGPEGRAEDPFPRPHEVRECGSAEEDADVMWLLHRPDRFMENPQKQMTLLCCKNRNGEVGKSYLYYDYTCGIIREGE